MSMSVPGAGGGDEDKALSDINTTPLVDIMLVMLIIFLITIPVVIPSVKIEMPEPRNIPTQTKVEDIQISVATDGSFYWNGQRVPDRARLLELVAIEARKVPQPEIHIKGDRNARYEAVARVIYTVQQGGIIKVGFLTEPKAALN
ncbi:MAG: biopolymer transporter ExbD [Nevskiaceae bacterium]|jgi:biopolymer transport protein ExbD|nr:biopolymer transporter ExbD [Nevskiaceae bacterium]